MSDENKSTGEEVFKAIGRLDEATEGMRQKAEQSSEEEERIVGFFTLLGRIIKAVLAR